MTLKMSNKILYQRILLLYLSGGCEISLIFTKQNPAMIFEDDLSKKEGEVKVGQEKHYGAY